MTVHVYYDGNDWALEDGIERAACQAEVKSLCATGGGIAEWTLADGSKIALTVSASIPITFVEAPDYDVMGSV